MLFGWDASFNIALQWIACTIYSYPKTSTKYRDNAYIYELNKMWALSAVDAAAHYNLKCVFRLIKTWFLIKYARCMMHINSHINCINLLILHNEIVITRNSNGLAYRYVHWTVINKPRSLRSNQLYDVVSCALNARFIFFHIDFDCCLLLLHFFSFSILSVPQSSKTDHTPFRITTWKTKNKNNTRSELYLNSFTHWNKARVMLFIYSAK